MATVCTTFGGVALIVEVETEELAGGWDPDPGGRLRASKVKWLVVLCCGFDPA